MVEWYLSNNPYVDNFSIMTRCGMTEVEVLLGLGALIEAGKFVDNVYVGKGKIDANYAVLQLGRARDEENRRKLIASEELIRSHEWVRGGDYGGGIEGFLKTKWYPYPSHCKKCGLDFDVCRRNPEPCPKA